MKKQTEGSPWGVDNETIDQTKTPTSAEDKARKAISTQIKNQSPQVEPLYDLEGLMTDFPTAKELEKFVYDKTGLVLELKGRSNKFKYQTALDVLNGQRPDSALLGDENPYLDKNDIIPVDRLRDDFPTPPDVQGVPLVTLFHTRQFPHPDPEIGRAHV